MAERLYLDHAATTPMLPAAREAVADAMARWANPSSPHAEGRAARAALEEARRRIAGALGWDGTVILTSGASEAIAIAMARAKVGERIVSATEHDAVLRLAADATTLPVNGGGIVDVDAIAGDRPLVAVQQVNSETGVIQPLDCVADAVRGAGGLLLADCAQGAGRLPLPDADFIVVSAHKLGGPPGIGALLVRDLAMLAPSGGQEFGYRPGTENLPGALGFAAALEAQGDWFAGAPALRERLESALIAEGGVVIADDAPRSAAISAYRMPGVRATAQLIAFDMAGIAVSAGSACASGSLKPSHVLAAMGMPEADAAEVIRVSFGATTTAVDVDRFIAVWTRIAADAKRRAA